MANYSISEGLAASIVQNIDDQVNEKKLALIALQRQINDLEAMRQGVLNSKKEIPEQKYVDLNDANGIEAVNPDVPPPPPPKKDD